MDMIRVVISIIKNPERISNFTEHCVRHEYPSIHPAREQSARTKQQRKMYGGYDGSATQFAGQGGFMPTPAGATSNSPGAAGGAVSAHSHTSLAFSILLVQFQIRRKFEPKCLDPCGSALRPPRYWRRQEHQSKDMEWTREASRRIRPQTRELLCDARLRQILAPLFFPTSSRRPSSLSFPLVTNSVVRAARSLSCR